MIERTKNFLKYMNSPDPVKSQMLEALKEALNELDDLNYDVAKIRQAIEAAEKEGL